MEQGNGQPIEGAVHSTDASAGVAVPIFEAGSRTARTLDADEYIEILSAQLVSAATGDIHLFTGPDASPGTGETVVRGTVAANGGIVRNVLLHRSKPGETAWFIAPAGISDCVFSGVIRKERQTNRASWREALPGR